MKQTMMEILRSLCPVLVTGGIVLCCATAPVLTAVPERLNWIPSTEAVQESKSAQRETVPAQTELPETSAAEPEPTQIASAEYQDGSFIGVGTGFGGEIKVEVRVEQGRIEEIKILSAQGETESFLNRARAVIDWILSAQSWEVDAVSGATYSSNGIKAAVKNALNGETEEVVSDPVQTATGEGDSSALREVKFEAPESGYRNGSYIGSAQGFGGLITVQVKVQGGSITQITVCAAPGETASFLERAKAVIPAILQNQNPNVDAVSGATYSSRGIINAVKVALRQAGNGTGSPESQPEPGKASGKETGKDSSKEKDETPTQTEPTESGPEPGVVYADGIYTGTGTGFGGPIRVEIKIQQGEMTDISILEAENETPEFLKKAEAVIGRILKAQSPEVDAVAGASYSSNGIREAVANALQTASTGAPTEPEPPAPSEPTEPEPSAPSEPTEPEPSAPSEPIEPEPPVPSEPEEFTETYIGKAMVLADENEEFWDYEIVLTVTVLVQQRLVEENGQQQSVTERSIANVTVDADTEATNLAFLNRAFRVIKQQLLEQKTDFDAVSGATCSSIGIRSAWEQVLQALNLMP